MSKDKNSTIRRPVMAVYMVFILLVVMLIYAPLIYYGNVIHDVADALVGAAIFAAGTFLVWSISWHSTLEICDKYLMVRNMFIVHRLPWNKIVQIGLSDGINIELDNGEIVDSIQFGGSLLGAMTGYPTYKRPCKRLEDALAEYKRSDVPGDEKALSNFSFPWIPAILWYVFFVIPALVEFFFG